MIERRYGSMHIAIAFALRDADKRHRQRQEPIGSARNEGHTACGALRD